MPLLLLKTKSQLKKRFNSSRDPSIALSILAFIPFKNGKKGDYISNNKYFNLTPFTITLKAIGYRSVFIYNFIYLRLFGALREGKLTI